MISNENIQRILQQDLHVHTFYSPCALKKSQGVPNQIIKKAENLGLQTIGFSDHFTQYPPYPTPIWQNCGKEMINSLRKDISEIDTPIKILIGVEADILNENKLSITDEYAEKLEYVIISASHFHLPGVKKPKSNNSISVSQHYVTMLKAVLNFKYVSIIAHPFKTPKNPYGSPLDYMKAIPLPELYAIAEMAKKQRIVMEINGQLGIEQEYLSAIKDFVRICKEVGVKFSYGSDAHSLKELNRSPGINHAIKELELEYQDFITVNELIENHRGNKSR